MSNTPFAYRRDIPFSLEIDETGDLKMLEDVDAINQSIYSILVSNNSGKNLEEEFGTNMSDILFENNAPGEFIKFEIINKIETSLKIYEPSIDISEIDINTDNISNGEVRVIISYLVKDGITSGTFDETLSLEKLT